MLQTKFPIGRWDYFRSLSPRTPPSSIRWSIVFVYAVITFLHVDGRNQRNILPLRGIHLTAFGSVGWTGATRPLTQSPSPQNNQYPGTEFNLCSPSKILVITWGELHKFGTEILHVPRENVLVNRIFTKKSYRLGTRVDLVPQVVLVNVFSLTNPASGNFWGSSQVTCVLTSVNGLWMVL